MQQLRKLDRPFALREQPVRIRLGLRDDLVRLRHPLRNGHDRLHHALGGRHGVAAGGLLAGELPAPEGDGATAPSGPGDRGARLAALRSAADHAVSLSGRYPRDAAPAGLPAVTEMPKSGVVVLRLAYPGFAVSETEEKEELTVSLWICPDRLTALALYWLRRGGVPADLASPERPEPDRPSYHALRAQDAPGEIAYWFSDDWVHNAPLVRGDPRAGGDRMGFLRDIVLVEAATWTYTRPGAGEKWRCAGMISGDAREVYAVLRALDESLSAPLDGP